MRLGALVVLVLFVAGAASGCVATKSYAVAFPRQCAALGPKEMEIRPGNPIAIDYDVLDPTLIRAEWLLRLRYEGDLERNRVVAWSLTDPDGGVREGSASFSPGGARQQEVREVYEFRSQPGATSVRQASALEAQAQAQDEYRHFDGTGFYTLRAHLVTLDESGEAAQDARAGRLFFGAFSGGVLRYDVELASDATADDSGDCLPP